MDAVFASEKSSVTDTDFVSSEYKDSISTTFFLYTTSTIGQPGKVFLIYWVAHRLIKALVCVQVS